MELAGENKNGGNSGKLAYKLMTECDISNVLHFGDANSNSPQETEALCVKSLEAFNTMVKPLDGRISQVLGNHDGAWGLPVDGVTYPYNMPRAKTYSRAMRKNHRTYDRVYSPDGTYYYIDDFVAKTRFIMMNTSDKPYETNANGTMTEGGNTMKSFTVRQAQVDWIISVLNGVPDGWSVISCSHIPLHDSIMESAIYLRNLYKAYKRKSTYSGSYAGKYGGTGGGTVAAYTNRADVSSSDFLIGQRLGGRGHSDVRTNEPNAYVTNYISCTAGDKIHIKQVGGTINYAYWVKGDGSSSSMNGAAADYHSSVMIYTIPNSADIVSIRFSVTGNADAQSAANNLIITVNENIVETEAESTPCWDALNINVDFTSAKGDYLAHFSGHAHNDYHYKAANFGIDMISIACDGRVSNNSYMTDEAYGNRELGTIYEQVLDAVVINRKTRVVKTVRIGAGVDREIVLG